MSVVGTVQENLYFAAAMGDVGVIHDLILKGGDVHSQDHDGNTVIHIAVRHQHLSVVKSLHELGVDINSQNADGWTPIYVAACCGDSGAEQFVESIIDLGADLNITSNSGWSPVLIATQKNLLHIVRVLVEAGADVDLMNDGGLSPAYLSACLSHWDICVYFINQGADISHFIALPWVPPNSVRDILAPFQLDTMSIREDPNSEAKCQILSIVKLLSSVPRNMIDNREDETNKDVEKDDLIQYQQRLHKFESALAVAFQSLSKLSGNPVSVILQANYPLRRRISRCAWKLYYCHYLRSARNNFDVNDIDDNDSRIIDIICEGEIAVKSAQQYAELMSLLVDSTMLTDLLSLRLSCKTNNYRQRFPVTCLNTYHELEERLVETFVTYGSSHLVPTGLVNTILKYFHGDNSSKPDT